MLDELRKAAQAGLAAMNRGMSPEIEAKAGLSAFFSALAKNANAAPSSEAKNTNAAQYSDIVSDGGLDPRNAAPQDQDAKPMVIGYFMRTAENGDSHYFSIPDTLPEGKYEIVLRAAMKEQKP